MVSTLAEIKNCADSTHTVFISISLIPPDLLFIRLSSLPFEWEESFSRNSRQAFFALLTAQEGVYCLLKYSHVRNMLRTYSVCHVFLWIKYTHTHKDTHICMRSHAYSHAYTLGFKQLTSSADMTDYLRQPPTPPPHPPCQNVQMSFHSKNMRKSLESFLRI